MKEYKNQIKDALNIDELVDENYKALYTYYFENLDISDIISKLNDEELDVKLRENIQKILSSVINLNVDQGLDDKNKLLKSLNQVIRKIKIRNLGNNTNSLESRFENNKRIQEINKTIFIK